jgi:ferrochelatase
VERIVALCLAPQYSKFSTGLYFRRVEEAMTGLDFSAAISWTKSYHDHPLLIEAFHRNLAPLLPCERVLFTAHSLPEKILDSGDPYVAETRDTARAVAERAGLAAWDFAFQSQGLTDERWLKPTVESTIEHYAREGVREMVLAPIGFVSDHVEILYDVDVLFRRVARERGIELRRPESLNDSPAFIAALAEVVRERLREA